MSTYHLFKQFSKMYISEHMTRIERQKTQNNLLTELKQRRAEGEHNIVNLNVRIITPEIRLPSIKPPLNNH